MEDSESETAETEPLVKDKERAREKDRKGRGPQIQTQQQQHAHPLARPRLSLVPETSERSADEETSEENSGKGATRGGAGAAAPPETPTPFCPFFGVKNYLHQFYERQEISNPALYEDFRPGPDQFLLVRQGEGRCSSSVFRLSMTLGGLLLLMGVIAFIVAAFAARATVIASQEGLPVTDSALAQQAQVDALLLVGLVAATLGSTTLAAALVSRTFCSRTEEAPQPFQFGQYPLEPPLSPSDKKVPATQRVTQVQPTPALIPYP